MTSPAGPRPGDALLHPVALAALAALLVNDHVLKWRCAGLVSGKLSDVAILVVGPLALHALCEHAAGRPLAPPSRALAVIVALSAAVYALEKTVPAATEVYRAAWGALRWPVDAAAALARGGALPGYAPVAAVTDPGDLVALPALALPLLVNRRRAPAA